MRNKRGEGYIAPCVMVVAICMIIAVLVSLVVAVNVIHITKKNSKIVLDSFVIENSILIYDSLKNGYDYTEYFDEEVYIDNLCDFCTFAKGEEFLYAYTEEGNLKYKISRPVLSFSSDSQLKLIANYTVYYPIDFNGIVIDMAEIPIKIESKFKEKF